MNKSVLALTTALSMLAFAPAFAEDMTGVDPNCIMKNTDGTETVDKAKCPDGKTMGAGNTNSTTTTQPADNSASTTTTTDQNAAGTTTKSDAPATTTAEQPSATATTTDQTASTTAPMDSSLIVPADIMKDAKVMSANDYIGKRVYDRAGNDIGEVNDLIISQDGKVQATVLGVGGFLGIGEKDVAVSVNAVEMVKDGDNTKLVVDATKDQLQAAPAFDRATRNYAG